jgi:hypothetical protein
LAGAANSVLWAVESGSLSTRFVSDDKHVLGEVKLEEFNQLEDDTKAGIFDTTLLKSMLTVLGKDIKLTYAKTGQKLTAIKLDDKSTKVTFVVSDEKVIPTVPNVKKLPDFELELNINDAFANTFIRAKGALVDVDTFTVLSDGKKAPQVVIGYSSTHNTNRVTIEAETEDNVELEAISFSGRYMKEILSANKEAESGALRVSSKGLAHVSFVIDGFEVEYYLVQIQTAD